jgi:hypothetical protein
MKHSSVRAFIAAALLAVGLQSSAQSPTTRPLGAETPDSLNITLKSATLQQRVRGPFEFTLFNTPHTLDVIKGDDKVGGQFATATPKIGTYTGIQFILDEQATFSGTDPCDGVTNLTNSPVKLADDGASELSVTYEEPHPVTGLAVGALPADPFKLDNFTPIDMHLIFPVTNSLVCLSDTPPLESVVGKQTGLGGPFGLAVDTTNNQYIVSSSLSDVVTLYDRDTVTNSTDPNIPPIYAITGDATQLSAPTGVVLDDKVDPDPTKWQILVANGGTNAITAYTRSDVIASTDGNVPPTRTISGPDTNLESPGGMFLFQDSFIKMQNELAVTSAVNNSVNFYPENTSGDTPPDYTIQGANTGLGSPCGVYVDSDSGEIYVSNNAFNSIAVYLLNDVINNLVGNVADISPNRFIQGNKTGMAGPCGIDVDVERDSMGNLLSSEIAVASSLNSRILFFDGMDGMYNSMDGAYDGNVYPTRRLQGAQTLISGPTGIKMDHANGVIAILNNGGLAGANLIVRCLGITGSNAQCNGPDEVAYPHMTEPPVLTNSITQQTIYVNYTFAGTVDPATGDAVPALDTPTGNTLPTQFVGYNYAWRIYDTNLRQEGNATNARLIPPSNVVFTLKDGSQVSNLELGCPAFTPFIILTLSTNCSLPLITTPYPPQSAPDFRIIAALFGVPIIKKLPVSVAPLTKFQMPYLNLHLTLDPSSAIVGMDWHFEDGNGIQIDTPNLLIQSQSISIKFGRPFADVDPCYKQVSGNATTLVYTSPSMGSDPRDLSNIQNNDCSILLNDVDTISFTATDSLGNRYVYQVSPAS